jgi:hypothetical protein
MCNVSCNSNDFYPVDVTLNKNGLHVVGDFPLSPQSFPPASPNSLQEAFAFWILHCAKYAAM